MQSERGINLLHVMPAVITKDEQSSSGDTLNITEEEYEALMQIRERAYEYSENMDSPLLDMVADLINRISYYVGKELFS